MHISSQGSNYEKEDDPYGQVQVLDPLNGKKRQPKNIEATINMPNLMGLKTENSKSTFMERQNSRVLFGSRNSVKQFVADPDHFLNISSYNDSPESFGLKQL